MKPLHNVQGLFAIALGAHYLAATILSQTRVSSKPVELTDSVHRPKTSTTGSHMPLTQFETT